MKIIILSRVSTNKQTLEQQTDACIRKCKSLGYSDDDIIIVENKESGISLSEDERKGLNKMKEHIEGGNIDAVIVWEISRIARQPKLLFSIRDYLIEHKIKLYCCEPDMQVIDSEGKIGQLQNMLFSIYASFAESEMQVKKERMIRGKKHKQHENGYIGGYVTLGYKIENGKIVIDEQKAKYVRTIFNMYERGDSIRTIVNEMVAQGVLEDNNEDNNRAKIRLILCHEGYTGQNSKTYPYPMIITPEQFNRCREIANNKRKPHTKTKRVYYLNGLLYNEVNDRKLTPSLANKVYSSYKYEGKESISINMDFIEQVGLYIVNEYMQKLGTNNDMKQRLKQQQLVLHRKIIASKKRIIQFNTQLDRIEERYIEGRINKVKAEKMRTDTLSQINENQKNVSAWEYEIPKISEQIKNSTYRTIYDMDDENKRIIVNNYVHKIFISKTNERGKYLMKVFMKNNEVPTEYTLISRNKKTKKLIKDGEVIFTPEQQD